MKSLSYTFIKHVPYVACMTYILPKQLYKSETNVRSGQG